MAVVIYRKPIINLYQNEKTDYYFFVSDHGIYLLCAES